MQGDDPPFLPVGTDVSAKYKGAFCEAKIRKVVRNIKCKVTLKAGGGSITVNDDVIKGTLRVGNIVEVKQDPKKDPMEAVITKIQDCSQYTVVFDDGDITTLRRSALCLKSGRHFNESETLDQLPLTHPEHFSTPVIAGRRGRRGRAQSDESSGSGSGRRVKADVEPHVGRVVLVEAGGGAERRRPHQPAFPALVVAPTAQIKVKEDYLVRSFKDGRYYTVPKKEAREFRKGSAPLEWAGVDAALQYLNNAVLPPHWDRDALFNEPRNTSDDSSDDEPREEKDHFVAQLYKFMDERGTPLNRNPTIANKDIDLYRLFKVVEKLGGYNRVTNQNQWKTIADKMGFHPVTTSITNLCKQAYKKFLHSYEDFYRKLGVTLVAHPRGARTPPAGRSLIRDRDRQPPAGPTPPPTLPATATQQRGKDKDSDKSETDKSEKSEKDEKPEKAEKIKEKARNSDEEDSADNQPLIVATPKVDKEKEREKEKEKEREKEKEKEKEREKEEKQKEREEKQKEKEEKQKEKEEKQKEKEEKQKEKEEKQKEKEEKQKEKEEKQKEKEEKLKEKEEKLKEKEEKLKEKEKEKQNEKEKEKEKDTQKEKDKSLASTSTSEEKEKVVVKPRSQSKGRTITPVRTEGHDKRTPKRRPLSSKSEGMSAGTSRASRRPHASTDSDSSGRASRCGPIKKMQSRRSQSANSASSGNTIASNSSKRPRKRKNTETSTNEPTPRSGVSNVKAQVGDKLKVYYGPTQSESKVTYEAKVIDKTATGDLLRVHYTGWNTRYDEWIKPQRIALNVTQHEQRNKKGSGMSRRVRSKRTEESSARSDSDSDSESDDDVKRPPKKSDDKSSSKPPSRSKDVKSSDSSSSSKPRKRPVRTVSTPTSLSPPKKTRPNAGHQGRDYDLNEIRSELKGLHTVKQEPEDAKSEADKESPPPAAPGAVPPEPMQQDKQAEDVYEFKEPEPFELELHDEKKKRTHRIFDDISPSKYTSTLSKSLSEEISEDPMRPRPSSLRSPSLSPFRDFGASREASRQSPEDDSKDGLFSLDDDSFPGDGSSGPTFEGFTPAKNQETYSKKSKVSKLRELIDDSPDSPADDEQSSDDEPEDIRIKEEAREPTPVLSVVEEPKTPETPVKDEPKEPEPVEPVKEVVVEVKEQAEVVIPEPPKTPPPQKKPDPPPTKTNIQTSANTITTPSIIVTAATTSSTSDHKVETIEKPTKEEPFKLLSAATPITEHKESTLKIKIEKKLDPVPVEPPILKLQPPSSPLIDTEEDKSEPDSPARLDVLPEPPPGFLLQSEGPKIAEKLLKAISSAKRLSMSPPPMDDRPVTPKTDTIKPIKPETKLSPISPELRNVKPESMKPLVKTDAMKRATPPVSTETVFGEPSNLIDVKRDLLDVKKAKAEEAPRLHSPLSVLERRKSVAELPLSVPGKNNKVLSDTIQKLSSQINQSAAAAAPRPSDTRSDDTDSDDEGTRLIIDKLVVDEWGSSPAQQPGALAALGALAACGMTVGARALHAGKSPGEWSAGESLLMLEDACKNERKHSASVVVAGGPREALPTRDAREAREGREVREGREMREVREGREMREVREARDEDGNISLLLCEETIPGSPAPDAEPAPPRQRLHMPFASAPPHQHTKEERRAGAGGAEGARGAAGAGGGEGAWARRARLDNTPPTTPDSSLDLSPHRERRISERDSPSERKEDEDEGRVNDAAGLDVEKAHGGGRSRKASESSAAGARQRTRRTRRDTDDAHAPHAHHAHHPPLKYNFYVELDPSWDCQTRINVLTSRLADLRKAYHSVKAELAAIDRRRKKLRRKEREAVKAAKAACS